MTKFEKYFWFSIVILLVSFILLNIFAFYHNNQSDNLNSQTSSIFGSLLTEIVNSDQLNQNLQTASTQIKQNFNKELKALNQEIDQEINPIFDTIINNNLENFLDFHYSVLGEYTELGAMATGNIAKTIEKRLLGSDFITKISLSTEKLDSLYKDKIQNHLSYINQLALQGVDRELNNISLTKLNHDIKRNLNIQSGKVGVILATAMAVKISQLIIAKISAKTLTSIAAKTTLKGSGKMAAASTAALAGSVCGGVGAIVCSPLFAAVTWFSVDVAFIASDEYLNRDNFKKEITMLLHQQQEQLKQDYKKHYAQSFSQVSRNIQLKYSHTPVQERKKIKLIDIIF